MQRRLLSEIQEYESELNEKELTGYIGEILVQHTIALKYQMRVHKIPDELKFDTDFITATGKRLEVETRRIERKIDKRKGRSVILWWHFKELKYLKNVGKQRPRQTPRQSDFYIFVCMPKTGYTPTGFYVVPSGELVKKNGKPLTDFAVTDKDFNREKCERSRWFPYQNKWELIEPKMFEKLKTKDIASIAKFGT
jgi:hypothetical protein